MKLFLILFACLLLAVQADAAWFDDPEQQRIKQLQIDLDEQRQATGGWQIASGLLAIGMVVVFTIGTALGSKARRHEH